jgi:hypothetical protein
MRYFHLIAIPLVLVLAGGILIGPNPFQGATAAEINRDAPSALFDQRELMGGLGL